MRKITVAAAVGAIASVLAGGTGAANAEERQLGYALTLGGSSDYMFRGISYSDSTPVVNAYQELTYGIAYAGFFTSKVDFGIYSPWEQDVYLGIRPVTGPVNWDLGALWYIFGNKDKGEFGSTSDIDYFEFKVAATTSPIAHLTIGSTVYLTPDQGYAATRNITLEGTAAYDLPKLGQFAPTLSGLIGYSDSGTNQYYPDGYWLNNQSYTYWNAGMKLTVEKFFMDLRYWDTTIDDELTDARFVFSAGVNLLP